MKTTDRDILKFIVDNKQNIMTHGVDLDKLEVIFKIPRNDIEEILEQLKVSNFIEFPDAIGTVRFITVNSKAIKFIYPNS